MNWKTLRIGSFGIIALVVILFLYACSPQESTVLPTSSSLHATEVPQASPTSIPPTETDVPQPTSTSEPTVSPTPEPTPTEVTSVEISLGAEGGELTSLDSQASLIFPPQSLQDTTGVTIDHRSASDTDGDIIAPVYDISLEPSLENYLEVAAFLRIQPSDEAFNPVDPWVTVNDMQVPAYRIARLTTRIGNFQTVDGETVEAIEYWQPLEYTLLDEDGVPVVWMSGFSNYTVTKSSSNDTCQPSAAELTPPVAPEGYVYVGRDVVINKVYRADYSTVDPKRPFYPTDQEYLTSRTESKDKVTTCDIIVVHIFAPADTATQVCEPTPSMLEPPQTPPCYEYVGYDVVINGRYVEGNVPLTRNFQKTDIVHITSDTTVVNGVAKCDIVVAHTFQPKNCNDYNNCTNDTCLNDQCYHEDIPDCETITCSCDTPGAKLVPAGSGCSWNDAKECTAWHSLCTANNVVDINGFPSGTTLSAYGCSLTLVCPETTP